MVVCLSVMDIMVVSMVYLASRPTTAVKNSPHSSPRPICRGEEWEGFFLNWWDKMKIAESEQTHEGSYIRYRNALKAFCTLYEKIEGTVLWMCFSPFCYSNLSVQLCQHTAKSKNMIKKATPPKLLCSKLLTFGVISPSPEMQSAVTIPVAQALKAQLCAQTLTQRGLDTDSNYRVKAFLEILPYCLFVAARKH